MKKMICVFVSLYATSILLKQQRETETYLKHKNWWRLNTNNSKHKDALNVLMMSSVAGIRSKNVSDSGTLARIQELCLLPKAFTLGKKKKKKTSPGAFWIYTEKI